MYSTYKVCIYDGATETEHDFEYYEHNFEPTLITIIKDVELKDVLKVNILDFPKCIRDIEGNLIFVKNNSQDQITLSPLISNIKLTIGNDVNCRDCALRKAEHSCLDHIFHYSIKIGNEIIETYSKHVKTYYDEHMFESVDNSYILTVFL